MESYKTELPITGKELNPQRNTYKFGSVRISSDFDNGNIWDVVQVSERYYTWGIVGDGQPFDDSLPFKKWFYFSIEGVEKGTVLIEKIGTNNQKNWDKI